MTAPHRTHRAIAAFAVTAGLTLAATAPAAALSQAQPLGPEPVWGELASYAVAVSDAAIASTP